MRTIDAVILASFVVSASWAVRSEKRGIAYDLTSSDDFNVLTPAVAWWYNWSPQPNQSVPTDYLTQFNMTFIPMLWDFNFDAENASSGVKYFMVLNEPNLVEQANVSPQDAARKWPQFEDVANRSGAALVGPQISWGTMDNYGDPILWMDAFYEAYRSMNNGRDPRIDYLGFHWYDYGLSIQLDRMRKYKKQYWVTEMANWHNYHDGADIDTPEKQEAQLRDMVSICEGRSDVFRYAWFTGRWTPDTHYTSILAGNGELTDVGYEYMIWDDKSAKH